MCEGNLSIKCSLSTQISSVYKETISLSYNPTSFPIFLFKNKKQSVCSSLNTIMMTLLQSGSGGKRDTTSDVASLQQHVSGGGGVSACWSWSSRAGAEAEHSTAPQRLCTAPLPLPTHGSWWDAAGGMFEAGSSQKPRCWDNVHGLLVLIATV